MRGKPQTIRFCIIHGGKPSKYVDAKLLNLSKGGIEIETSHIEVGGFHISYNDSPAYKNRVILQWEKDSGKLVQAVGQTDWYERISGLEEKYLVRLKFLQSE